jgi:hypothetical protein
MDLLITDTHFEIGQYVDDTKTELIAVLKVNKDDLKIEYAKFIELVRPILCIKI